jgi:hypothetical protein
MILACRVLRSSVGQGSRRSQRMDGVFGTYRIARSSLPSSAGCRRCCGGIAWLRRARSCAGIVAW